MIFNLQILRAIAAIGVVIYHIDYNLRPGLHTDFLGVATFFVLSGFIMCYVTKDDADGFLVARVIRIVPLYWLCTLTRVIILGGSDIVHSSFWSQQSAPIIRSLLFLPSDTPPLVAVGWTLNFEMYFYLIFAISLSISQRLAPLIALSAVAAVMTFDAVAPGNFVVHYYSDSYIVFFLDGIALFYLWRFIEIKLPKSNVIFLCAATLLCAYAAQLVTSNLGQWRATIPVLVVGSALFMARAGADLNVRPLILLGNASYSIYLIHTLCMGSIRRIAPAILERGETNAAWFLALLALCVMVGLALHLLIEKPMLRLIRSALASFRLHPPPSTESPTTSQAPFTTR